MLGDLLAACEVEPLTDTLARLAGRALGEVGSDRTIDAIVVASGHSAVTSC